MDEEVRRSYLAAGEIVRQALKLAVDRIHVGMPIEELCNLVEGYILDRAELAFPCNISVNEVAAHDSADLKDERVIPKLSLVKVDVGAHVNGYIADAAVSVSFSKTHTRLLKAAKSALDRAVEVMKPGVSLGAVGGVIEKTIRSFGYRPIVNLSGHLLSRYVLHAGKSVPNIRAFMAGKVLHGEVYAVEPFATNGMGRVLEGRNIRIFSLKATPRRKPKERFEKLARLIWLERRGLPFSARWYVKRFSDVDSLVWSMYKRGMARGYPVLIEVEKGLVAQFEYTVIIERDGAFITTPLDFLD